MGSFVRNSHVSTLCPVVICPYFCTSEGAWACSQSESEFISQSKGSSTCCVYVYKYIYIYIPAV